jgi:hypothetical protein
VPVSEGRDTQYERAVEMLSRLVALTTAGVSPAHGGVQFRGCVRLVRQLVLELVRVVVNELEHGVIGALVEIGVKQAEHLL